MEFRQFYWTNITERYADLKPIWKARLCISQSHLEDLVLQSHCVLWRALRGDFTPRVLTSFYVESTLKSGLGINRLQLGEHEIQLLAKINEKSVGRVAAALDWDRSLPELTDDKLVFEMLSILETLTPS
jgi:hypothetical protein